MSAARDAVITSAPRDRADDQEGLLARHHLVGQWCIWRNVRPVLLAGEEPDHRTASLGGHVPNRPAQRWMVRFQRIEDCPLSHRSGELPAEALGARHIKV